MIRRHWPYLAALFALAALLAFGGGDTALPTCGPHGHAQTVQCTP